MFSCKEQLTTAQRQDGVGSRHVRGRRRCCGARPRQPLRYRAGGRLCGAFLLLLLVRASAVTSPVPAPGTPSRSAHPQCTHRSRGTLGPLMGHRPPRGRGHPPGHHHPCGWLCWGSRWSLRRPRGWQGPVAQDRLAPAELRAAVPVTAVPVLAGCCSRCCRCLTLLLERLGNRVFSVTGPDRGRHRGDSQWNGAADVRAAYGRRNRGFHGRRPTWRQVI